MALTRRQFIQIGAASAGGAAVASGLGTRWWGLDGDPVPDPRTDGDTVVPTYCELCFWGCGMLAHVQGDRVTKVVGNPQNPLSRGILCPRGAGATGLLDDPDRLKRPMIRRAKRGEDVFEEVSWDAALGEVSEKLLQVKARHGAEALALFTHGSGGTWFKALMKAWGSPNIGAPSYAQCRGPREAAFQLTFGAPLGSPEPLDLANSRCITLIGSHLGENMHNTQVQELAEALGKGADLVVVDPRFSVAASKARYWLPVKPGTDIALLLAWMNVLISENLHDKDYIDTYAVGFDQLAKHVREFTPEWAEPITEIPAARIRETARAMGAAKPAVAVHPGRHVTWYGDDTQRARAMAILTALLGSWGRKGGIFLPTPIERGSFDLPDYPEPKRGRADGAGTRFPLAPEELGVTNGLIDATLSGDPYPIKAWIVYGQNMLESIPQPARTVEAIGKLDLMVVVDVLPVDQIRYADLVLPEATYLERYDPPTIVESGKRPFIAVRSPACEPLYESKPGWWIAREMAKRLDLMAFFPWETPQQHLEKILAPTGVNPKQLLNCGAVSFPGKPYLEDRSPEDRSFGTASGKIELFSQELADHRADPMPRYTAPSAPPKGFLRLIYGRAPVHSFARSQNNEALHALMPENEVWFHTTSARAFGVAEGELVLLENGDGVRSSPVLVKVTEGIRNDCAYLVHGFGQQSKALRRAHGRGASDNSLMSRVSVDPLTGGTGMRVNFVRPVRA